MSKTAIGKKCTLNDTELIDKVQEWVSRLCKSGGSDWRLHVPVSFNTDPDMLITELCNRFKEYRNQSDKAAIQYQLCPKCNGQGIVCKPPYVAGDVHEWTSNESVFTCDICNGSKIIPMCGISSIKP